MRRLFAIAMLAAAFTGAAAEDPAAIEVRGDVPKPYTLDLDVAKTMDVHQSHDELPDQSYARYLGV